MRRLKTWRTRIGLEQSGEGRGGIRMIDLCGWGRESRLSPGMVGDAN
jgi:hypothetical protein